MAALSVSAAPSEGAPQQYVRYCSRFTILALYGLANATNAFMWICFAPIVDTMQARFAVSAFAVNFLSLVFMILYGPGTILAVYVMERYGLRACLITGAVMNMVGAWVRYTAVFIPDPHTAFAVLMVGQCVAGLAQPIFTNLPSRIAGDWFPVSERDLGTVVGAMANPLGNAAGSVVPAIIVASTQDIPALLLYQGIWTSALAVLTAIFVRDRPPTPPSAGAELKLRLGSGLADADLSQTPTVDFGGDAARTAPLLLASAPPTSLNSSVLDAPPAGDSAAAAIHRMLKDFSLLLRNANFLRLLFAFGMGVGIFNALLTLLAQLIQPCGYGADDAGVAGGALLGAGLIGAIFMGVLMEKTRAYMPLLKAGILLVTAATVFMLASIKPNSTAQMVAAFGVMGFALIPLLPVSLENAAECTYPIPEDNSAGLLLLAGNVIGIIYIFALTALIGIAPSSDCSSVVTPAAGMIVFSFLVAALVLLTFKRDYRRQHAEHARKLAAAVASPPLSPL